MESGILASLRIKKSLLIFIYTTGGKFDYEVDRLGFGVYIWACKKFEMSLWFCKFELVHLLTTENI